jgi:hypothetical protein
MTAMRALPSYALLALCFVSGCSRASEPTSAVMTPTAQQTATHETEAPKEFVGFDRNEYPGDAAMAAMKPQFAFVGYWLTAPPGAKVNHWTGKRNVLRTQGWGFLLLANGKLEAEIKRAAAKGTSPTELGRKDAAAAAVAAKAEGFPQHAIIFLDQEEGGRLTDVQAQYLLAWTEALAATDYRPGVYASGQLVDDGPGARIDTIEDIRDRVKKGSLHEIAIFDAQDACPPASGCTVKAAPMKLAGEPDLTAWQYSQSPRRPDITRSCAATYAKDGNCYPPAGLPHLFLDMDVATSADPSHGR